MSDSENDPPSFQICNGCIDRLSKTDIQLISSRFSQLDEWTITVRELDESIRQNCCTCKVHHAAALEDGRLDDMVGTTHLRMLEAMH